MWDRSHIPMWNTRTHTHSTDERNNNGVSKANPKWRINEDMWSTKPPINGFVESCTQQWSHNYDDNNTMCYQLVGILTIYYKFWIDNNQIQSPSQHRIRIYATTGHNQWHGVFVCGCWTASCSCVAQHDGTFTVTGKVCDAPPCMDGMAGKRKIVQFLSEQNGERNHWEWITVYFVTVHIVLYK